MNKFCDHPVNSLLKVKSLFLCLTLTYVLRIDGVFFEQFFEGEKKYSFSKIRKKDHEKNEKFEKKLLVKMIRYAKNDNSFNILEILPYLIHISCIYVMGY